VWDPETYSAWQEDSDRENAKAKLMLYSLNILFGDQQFDAFIKSDYGKRSFKIATQKDFITSAEEIYGTSLKHFFDAWLGEALPPVNQK
jgi:aminopeptidase N